MRAPFTYSHMIRDGFLACLFIAMALLMQARVFGGPTVRGFFVNDMTIQFPYTTHETVPMTLVYLYCGVLPFLLMLGTWVFVDGIYKNDFEGNSIDFESVDEYFTGMPAYMSSTPSGMINESPSTNNLLEKSPSSSQISSNVLRPMLGSVPAIRVGTNFGTSSHWAHDVRGSPRARKLRWALYEFIMYGFILLGCVITTEIVKDIVGRLRPDFIDRCQPDYTRITIDTKKQWVTPEQVPVVCTNSGTFLIKGRQSFPSGHSSSAAVGAMFLIIYSSKRLGSRLKRAIGYMFLPVLQLAVLIVALAIAASRHMDYRHHSEDIICGLVLGFLYGLLYLIVPSYTPSWEIDGSVQYKPANEMGV